MTDLHHQQQKSPDTEKTETQQGGHTHHIPKEPSATFGKRQTNHTLDTILVRPAKRKKESTSEYTKPNTTATPHGDTLAGDSGDAASLTTNETEKNVQAAGEFLAIMQNTHGLQSRAGSANEVQRQKSTRTPQGQAIYDDLVSRDTTTPRTEPKTPSRQRHQTGGIDTPAENDYAQTFRRQPPTPTNYGVLVGRETRALTLIEGHFTATPHTTVERRATVAGKSKKKRTGTRNTSKHSHRF